MQKDFENFIKVLELDETVGVHSTKTPIGFESVIVAANSLYEVKSSIQGGQCNHLVKQNGMVLSNISDFTETDYEVSHQIEVMNILLDL